MLLEQDLLFGAAVAFVIAAGVSLDKGKTATFLAFAIAAFLSFFTFLNITFPPGGH